MQKLVRITNAAEILGLKPSTLRDWFLKRKNLDFAKAGRAVCVTQESLEKFIAANIIPAREGSVQAKPIDTRKGLGRSR